MLTLVDSYCCPNPLENVDLSGRWSPPPAEVVKINVDGSWDCNSRNARVGVVARDHLGRVLWTRADCLDFSGSPSVTEGQALLLSMTLAHMLGIRKAVFEVDSIESYKGVSIASGVGEWSVSWLGAAVELLQLNPDWSVRYADKASNKVADWLAHKARYLLWRWNRLDDIPFAVSSVL